MSETKQQVMGIASFFLYWCIFSCCVYTLYTGAREFTGAAQNDREQQCFFMSLNRAFDGSPVEPVEPAKKRK